MVKYCFIWIQELILKPLGGFLAKTWVWWGLGLSTINWVCKWQEPSYSEEMEYALCWRKSPVVLFPLKEKEKRQKEKKHKTPANWDLLSSLPHPYNPAVRPAQVPEPVPTPPPQVPASSTPLPNPSTSTPFPPYLKPLPTMTSKVVRTMSSRHWESIFSWRRKTPLPLASQEVPLGGGEIGFVNVPLTRSEVQTFEKELWPLLEDPFRVLEQVDQFLGPQINTWAELMSILGILFSGEEWSVERQWLSGILNTPRDKVSWWLRLSLLIKIPDEINTPGHWENIRDLRNLTMRG
jgi:hypothetical protein